MSKKNSPVNPRIGTGRDFQMKEPTRAEKMIWEVATHLEKVEGNLTQVFKILNDINQRLVALSRAKMEPEVLTQFFLDLKSNEAYIAKLNNCIDDEMAKRDKQNEKRSDIGAGGIGNASASGATPPGDLKKDSPVSE